MYDNWSTDHTQLRSILFTYFQNLFTIERYDLHYLKNINFPKFAQYDKYLLFQLYIDVEIKTTIWKLGAWKALGPDGILVGFYKDHWDLVGQQIL